MKTNYLKIFRIVFSLLMLVIGSFLFVDFASLMPNAVYKVFGHSQFVPSLFTLISAAAATGLVSIGILLLSLFFGRVYCSTLCPLGTLQDVVSFISKRTSRKRKIFRFIKESYWLRYSLLAIAAISVLAGTSLVVNLLDPYSNFGKIFSVLVRPLYTKGNNILAFLLEKINNFTFYSVDLKQQFWAYFIYPALFFITVFIFSFFKGRLYCNSICPVGTLLGLVSKFSIFKIKIEKDNCIRCARCSIVCKGGCIDVKNKEVDFSRCVGCFNCLQTCSEKAIGYRFAYAGKKTVDANISKRNFLIQTTVIASALTLSNRVKAQKSRGESTGSNKPINRKGTVTPPGSVSIDHFNKTCTACHLCVSACPMRVIQPSTTQYGLKGFMQPFMDYSTSYCNQGCITCTKVCPTGALTPVSYEAKKTLQLGLVNFVKENCVVFVKEKSCGACAEHCPTAAVSMIPYKDNLTIPTTIHSLCIGCGACENVCPARPYKAIFVDANPVHLLAQKPHKQEKQQATQEDFPF